MVISLLVLMLGICILLATLKPKNKWPPISYPLSDEVATKLRKEVERLRSK